MSSRLVSVGATALLAAAALAGTAPVSAATPAPAAPAPALTWGPCEDGVDPEFECATLEVPLDYEVGAAGGVIPLVLIRLPANPSTRQGAVLFNPGGPGGSGFDFTANIANALVNRSAAMANFDLVGFDPRGVDRSGAISCVDDATLERMLYDDETTADRATLDALDTVFEESCRTAYGGALIHYSTANTARDMDLIRAALGDEQLSYIGISYGTYLGAVYATLFPERVRAMVLDAAAKPGGDDDARRLLIQRVGFQDAFGNWAAWCEETSECAFTTVDVTARWDELLAQLAAAPIQDTDGRWTNPTVMETATISALYSELAWPMLGSALARAEQGDGSGLLRLADSYNSRQRDGSFASIHQAHPVIRCASGIGLGTPDSTKALLSELRTHAPQFARGITRGDLDGSFCVDLIGHEVDAIVPSYHGAAPIVVVGGHNDPATPFVWAEELTALMGPSASLVSFTGEGHGQILSSDCVTEIELAAITNLQLPAPGTECHPDPAFERPEFWDQLPVPPGVGAPVTDPLVDYVLGLGPRTYYSGAWSMAGDLPSVLAGYESELAAIGFSVLPPRDDVIDGATALYALWPDGNAIVVLLFPAEMLAADEDFLDLADVVGVGEGLVVIAAFDAT